MIVLLLVMLYVLKINMFCFWLFNFVVLSIYINICFGFLIVFVIWNFFVCCWLIGEFLICLLRYVYVCGLRYFLINIFWLDGVRIIFGIYRMNLVMMYFLVFVVLVWKIILLLFFSFILKLILLFGEIWFLNDWKYLKWFRGRCMLFVVLLVRSVLCLVNFLL